MKNRHLALCLRPPCCFGFRLKHHWTFQIPKNGYVEVSVGWSPYLAEGGGVIAVLCDITKSHFRELHLLLKDTQLKVCTFYP